MAEQNCPRDFEQEALPHLDAAYNLARWLTCNDQDAQDLVQEAYIRAFRFFGESRGANVRPWLQLNRLQQPATKFDEELFVRDPDAPNLEEALLRIDSGKLLRQALESLPAG